MQHLPLLNFVPNIYIFLCDCCLNIPDIEKSNLTAIVPANFLQVKELCLSKSKPEQLRLAFESGADGVMLCGCQIGKCQNSDNVRRLRIIHQNQRLLKEMGLEPHRLGQEYLAPGCPKSLRDCVVDFTQKIQRMGPARRPGLKSKSAEA